MTSNLFKFVTLRGPEAFDTAKAKSSFVSISEEAKNANHAFKAIEANTANETRSTVLRSAFVDASDFSLLASKAAVKQAYPNLHSFSLWLAKNKNSLSFASISDNLLPIPKPTVKQVQEGRNIEAELWNQLTAQVVQKQSVAVRELLVQMLIGLNFYKVFTAFEPSILPRDGSPIFTAEEKEQFQKLANASVIIPKELLASTKTIIREGNENVPTLAQKYLETNLRSNIAKERLKAYNEAKRDISIAKKYFDTQEQKRYEQALKYHNISVKLAYDDATPKEELIQKEGEFDRYKKSYPKLDLPEFNYEKSPELVRGITLKEGEFQPEGNFVKPKPLQPKTLALLNTDDFAFYDGYTTILNELDIKIKAEEAILSDNIPEKDKDITIGNNTVNFNITKSLPLHYYSLGMFKLALDKNKKPLVMVLNAGKNVGITAAEYTLKNGLINVASDTAVLSTIPAYKNELINVNLFPNGILLQEGIYQFKGEFTLSNGKVLLIECAFPVAFKGEILEEFVTGVAKEKKVDDGNTNPVDTTDETTEKTGMLYGVSQLGIADFRRVEQEVCCYVPGEVSHIENIMAREYKESTTRDLRVSDVTSETSTEREVENLKESTLSERNELQNEASSIVDTDNATSFGANASVTSNLGFSGTTFNAGTNFNSSSANSTSDANSQAQSYAQEVTERALERVVQKVSSKRTSRMLHERETTTSNGFDNRKGDSHVTGVYRWVDKIYKNKLINYGKRLMYEFTLPEPAKFYINSYLINTDKDETTDKDLLVPTKPIHPSKLKEKITDASKLNGTNYQKIAAQYGAEVTEHPKKEIVIGKAFSKGSIATGGKGEYGEVIHGEENIKIPEGYAAIGGFGLFKVAKEGHVGDGGTITVGDREFGKSFYRDLNVNRNIYPFKTKYFDTVPVAFSSLGFHTTNVSVSIKCEFTEEALKQWQNETYKAILDAYDKRVQEYNEFKQTNQEEVTEVEKKKELASQINRSIEKRELKRIAIDLMTAPFKNITTAKNHYTDKDYKNITITKGLQQHAEVVKFFEQAFDWEIMAYAFYPYFYGHQDNWDANFKYNEGSDPIFQAFLQSGMARTVVPVKPGFEQMVTWFMETGEVWNGTGMVTDANDALYLSIAEEMQVIEGEVEESWTTRVPTSLTIIQAKSAALEEGGLPCNEDCDSHGLFTASETLVGDKKTGIGYDTVAVDNTVA